MYLPHAIALRASSAPGTLAPVDRRSACSHTIASAHLGVYYQKALGAAESPPLAASLDLARMLSLADTLLAVAMPQTPAVAVDPPA